MSTITVYCDQCEPRHACAELDSCDYSERTLRAIAKVILDWHKEQFHKGPARNQSPSPI